MESGTLLVVATPLGNLEDASARLRRVLRESALILAEDTRRTRQLCEALGVTGERGGPAPRIARSDEHVEASRIEETLELLRQGRDVALVSDAGTPCINDPGYLIVKAVHEAGLPVSPVPGPSAVTAALSASGLPSHSFVFEGFLPRKQGARRRLLAALADEPRTLIVFETPHRAAEAFADAAEILGAGRPAFLGRELTKLHEECLRATLGEIAERAARSPLQGEIVLVIAPAAPSHEPAGDAELVAEVAALVETGISEKEALRRVAKANGLHKRDLYRLVKIPGAGDDGAGDDGTGDDGAGDDGADR